LALTGAGLVLVGCWVGLPGVGWSPAGVVVVDVGVVGVVGWPLVGLAVVLGAAPTESVAPFGEEFVSAVAERVVPAGWPAGTGQWTVRPPTLAAA
jgi:hypothetical protein